MAFQPRKSNSRFRKPASEFKEKTLEIGRVTRVVAGGKRFSFRVAMVIGNEKGRVGFGLGKGLDVAQAVEKAKVDAKKHLISIELFDNRTIPYDIEAKYGAARVRLKPARLNHGLIAGGACRVVLELVGVKDISAKTLGNTTNKITNAQATIKALQNLRPVKKVEKKIEVKKSEENE